MLVHAGFYRQMPSRGGRCSSYRSVQETGPQVAVFLLRNQRERVLRIDTMKFAPVRALGPAIVAASLAGTFLDTSVSAADSVPILRDMAGNSHRFDALHDE